MSFVWEAADLFVVFTGRVKNVPVKFGPLYLLYYLFCMCMLYFITADFKVVVLVTLYIKFYTGKKLQCTEVQNVVVYCNFTQNGVN